MAFRKVEDTGSYSYRIGEMVEGCKLCVQGLKEVIFITGLCPKKPFCFYCPISDEKRGYDKVYANEWPIDKTSDIVTEAKLCNSKGAGITGGDPLARLDRTVKVIKMLKKQFGKAFHIHLYTPLELVDENKIKKLEKAGLDEIRFHPKVDDDKLWIRMFIKTKMSKGVEIPVIPGMLEETKKLLNFIDGNVDFLNLNELEVSDTNINKVSEKGFKTLGQSYAVEGSADTAIKLLNWCVASTRLNVHFCTVKLKDSVQLPNRIKRRAKNIAKDFDMVTEDGALIRAAVYTPDLVPGFGHTRKLKAIKDKPKIVAELKKMRLKIMKQLRISPKSIIVDPLKLRLLTSLKIANKHKDEIKKMNLVIEAVEELPTYDQFEIESEEL
jgi:pyruvate formate-lyase activating enzyme-like uncharacterized protein